MNKGRCLTEEEKIWRTKNIENANKHIQYWNAIKSGWINKPGLMFDASRGDGEEE